MKIKTFIILMSITIAFTLFNVEKTLAFTNNEEVLIYGYTNEILKSQNIDFETRFVALFGAAILKEIIDQNKGLKFNPEQIQIRISGVLISEAIGFTLNIFNQEKKQ